MTHVSPHLGSVNRVPSNDMTPVRPGSTNGHHHHHHHPATKVASNGSNPSPPGGMRISCLPPSQTSTSSGTTGSTTTVPIQRSSSAQSLTSEPPLSTPLYINHKRHTRSRKKHNRAREGIISDDEKKNYFRENALGMQVLCLCGQERCKCRGGGRFVDEGGRWVKKAPSEVEKLAQVQGCLPFHGESDALVDMVSVQHVPMLVLTKSHPHWMPDRCTKGCSLCTRAWTIFFRRHHCRGCGLLVCSICSQRGDQVPPRWRASRICNACSSSLFLLEDSTMKRATAQRSSSVILPDGKAYLGGQAGLAKTYS